MSQSLSVKSFSELQPDEPIINLNDSSVVLQFASCVRHLSINRRQSIWAQNVSLNGAVQPQTRLRQQVDDILLFLVIIFGKEQYPEAEERLISKLKVFVASSPFISLKQYIEQKCFPLYEHEFIQNADYFSNLIEGYARSQLMFRVNSFRSESSTPSLSMSSMDNMYSKLEEKMIDLFASKFGELEFRLNNIEKEVYSVKSILKKESISALQTKHPEFVSTDTIMTEIQNIKKEMCKISKGTNKKKNNKEEKKKRARTLSRISPKHKNERDSASKKKKEKKKKNSGKKNSKNKPKAIKCNPKQTEQEMEKKEDFKQWLCEECELSEYLNVFTQNKLDNLCVVQCLKTSDLALLGIANNSDKIKLMQYIEKLKYERRIQNRSV